MSPLASPGSMNVDWEERWNVERLRTYRTTRARDALAASDLGRGPAVRLQQHPLRHEHPHRGVGARQDDPLRAADPRRRSAHLGLRLGRQAPPAQLPVAAAGEHPRRDGRAARRRGAGRRPVPVRRARDRGDPPRRGRGRHAARRRHRRAADARRPGRGRRHGPRRPAGPARRARGQVEGRDHPAQHRLLDGRRRLPAAVGAAQAGRPRERPRGQRHAVPVRDGLGARRQHQRGVGRALQPAPARLLRPDHPARRPGLLRHHPHVHRLQDLLLPDVRGRHGHRRPARRLQAGARVDRRVDRAHAPRRHDRPGRERLAEGAGVRLRQRDGVLRAPVRPQRRAVPPRAADHQPAQLARAPGRAQGGDGHRPRDVLPGQGRRSPRRGSRRRSSSPPTARRSSPASRPTSCSSPTPTDRRAGGPNGDDRARHRSRHPAPDVPDDESSAGTSRSAPRSCSSRGWSAGRRTSVSARRRSRPGSRRRCAPTTTRSARTAGTTTRSPGACRWRRSSPSCSGAGRGCSAARAARCT